MSSEKEVGYYMIGLAFTIPLYGIVYWIQYIDAVFWAAFLFPWLFIGTPFYALYVYYYPQNVEVLKKTYTWFE